MIQPLSAPELDARADDWRPDLLAALRGLYGDRADDLAAAMEKRADGWYWAEWSADGDAKFSGMPSTCTDCHQSGADFVRAFPLPK